MDIVITYVNGLDPQWLDDYRRVVGDSFLEKRFRDWGTLPYLLRGIQTYMPFVRNVYLVVASESQVPQWAVRENLRIVLHSDIIPEECLPLFNSASIEMFLHRIKGLDEQFIYFNDDIFPVAPCTPDDFFQGGRPAVGMARHLFATNLYRKQTRNSDRLAREAAGVRNTLGFMRPQHICTPMLKSESEELFSRYRGKIMASVSALREPDNYNQYLFTDYLYFKGTLIDRRIRCKHFSMALASIDSITSFLHAPSAPLVCINDVQMPQDKYLECRRALLKAFDEVLPQRSIFEFEAKKSC